MVLSPQKPTQMRPKTNIGRWLLAEGARARKSLVGAYAIGTTFTRDMTVKYKLMLA
jgi:hypothetical protein